MCVVTTSKAPELGLRAKVFTDFRKCDKVSTYLIIHCSLNYIFECIVGGKEAYWESMTVYSGVLVLGISLSVNVAQHDKMRHFDLRN